MAPGDTTPAATKRRLERTLANDRLDPETAWPQLARAVLAGWAGGPIVLILDETLNRNDLRCLKLTLAYRKRAICRSGRSAMPPAASPGRCRR